MSLRGLYAHVRHSIDIRLRADFVDATLAKYGVEPWFSYVFRERRKRWDIWEPSMWLATRLSRNALILEAGCGCALNLIWLGQTGFRNLYGFDIDPGVIAAARELSVGANVATRLWVDDGLHPRHLPDEQFDAVVALNWVHLLEAFELRSFLECYAPILRPGGYLVIDMIDSAYNNVVSNQFHTSDWSLPEIERRPSEYRQRFSESEMRGAAELWSLRLVRQFRRTQAVPKGVYVFRRGTR